MPLNNAGFLPVTIRFMDSILPDLVTNNGEMGSRGYHAIFFDAENNPIIPSTVASAKCYGYNTDTDKTYYTDGTPDGENGWYLEVPSAAISGTDRAIIQIVLSDGDKVKIKTIAKTVYVGRSITQDASSNPGVLIDYKMCVEAAKNANQAADRANQSREAIEAAEELRKEAERQRVENEDKRQANTLAAIKGANDARDYILSDVFEDKVNPLHVGPDTPTEPDKKLWLDTDENGTEIIEVGPSTPESAATRLWVDTEAN